MRNVTAIAMIAMGMAAAAPSMAQKQAETIEVQQAIYDYGSCLVQARPRQVERYLATPPLADSGRAMVRQMAMTACLEDGAINFDPEAVRGPFYQALYRKDFRDELAADLKSAPTLDYSRGMGGSEVQVNLRRFADCAIRQDSKGARNLAFSSVGSAQEKAALQALKPAMASCIAPSDKISLSLPLLRSVLAEVLYRLSAASVGRPSPLDRK